MPLKEDLVKKWAEEIRTALRDFHPHVVHAETISDVQAAIARDSLVFILLKETIDNMGRVPKCRNPYTLCRGSYR